MHLVVVASKKLVNRLQVAPKSQLDETVLWVVHVSGPIHPQVLKSKGTKELKALQDLARKEMLELLEMPARSCFRITSTSGPSCSAQVRPWWGCGAVSTCTSIPVVHVRDILRARQRSHRGLELGLDVKGLNRS